MNSIRAIPNIDLHDAISHSFSYDFKKNTITVTIKIWDACRILTIQFINPISFIDKQRDSLASLVRCCDIENTMFSMLKKERDNSIGSDQYQAYQFIDISDDLFVEIICQEMKYKIEKVE